MSHSFLGVGETVKRRNNDQTVIIVGETQNTPTAFGGIKLTARNHANFSCFFGLYARTGSLFKFYERVIVGEQYSGERGKSFDGMKQCHGSFKI